MRKKAAKGNREEWLGRLVEALRPLFTPHTDKLPKRIRVSCGWPSRRALAAKNRTIGQAWSTKASADGSCETFISPVLDRPVEVADVLVHEMVHHAVGVKEGHKAPFRRLAVAIGLEGKMTATHAGKALKERLTEITGKLGPYPHAKLSPTMDGVKKQTTRMLKIQCAECECIVRMTQKWLDDAGIPTCGCGGEMTEA